MAQQLYQFGVEDAKNLVMQHAREVNPWAGVVEHDMRATIDLMYTRGYRVIHVREEQQIINMSPPPSRTV